MNQKHDFHKATNEQQEWYRIGYEQGIVDTKAVFSVDIFLNTRQEPIQADHLDRNCCNCNEYAPAIHSSMHGMCLKSERRKVVDFNSTCDKFKPIQDQVKQESELMERIKKLEFMIENGLGWKDMENDITY
jgi:hypothetical protein